MAEKFFDSFQIGGLEIKNRLVASAMFEYAAADGKITETFLNHYSKLAQGGWGLIIGGMQAVSASGAVAPIMVNTAYPDYVADMKKVVAEVHRHDAKIFVQLQHAGTRTFPTEGYDKFSVDDATPKQLETVIKNFGRAAANCKAAGVDGVQIHAAHGFLINSFLSPSTNHRVDNFGGTIENRALLLYKIYDSIRASVGENFIVGVKFPFSDLIEPNITPEESLSVLKELERRGLDFAEISSGLVMDESKFSFTPRIGKNEAPFLASATLAAENLKIPVVSVCGYRTPDFVEKVLTETKIAAVSFGRPTVREPNLANRWRVDKSRAKCISCNKCRDSVSDGEITCQVEKILRAKK
ncbi:MAG: NADH:flavin oxidoreductase [Selenomonadaceae bacterium]|nr:NADH:flavin oxidoreductase [Selenomonadaceae bacterium]